MGSSVIYSAFADRTATQSVLPDTNEKVVFVYPFENENIGAYPYDDKTLFGNFTLPTGETISYELDLLGIPTVSGGPLPSSYSGHFLPTNLPLKGSLGNSKNFTVKAYQYEDGKGDVRAPEFLVSSSFTDEFSTTLPALEDTVSRDPMSPDFRMYIWAFVLNIDGVNVEFATVVQGGLNAKRVKGFSFPF